MHRYLWQSLFFCITSLLLVSCATRGVSTQDEAAMFAANSDLPLYHGQAPYSMNFDESRFASRLPSQIDTGNEKTIMVDPKVYAWGAYNPDGQLIKAGIATAGAEFCADEGKPCKTDTGTFRVTRLGGEDCTSKTYPIGKGGSLMPYCIFFHNGESLHGSPDQMLVEQNISHGCVHMRIPDVAWLRNNFVKVGTKVVVLPY